jgi:glycosyltransferase involved in cell wall biosynthesis
LRILFVHQNFPGQFLHLAPALAARGHEVQALRITPKAQATTLWRGVLVHSSAPQRGNAQAIHPWLSDLETKFIRGEAAWHMARALKAGGFTPDVIYAHPGWGESLFLKEVWPCARLVLFGEFFYTAEGADLGFDPEFQCADPGEDRCRLQARNLNQLSQLALANLVISPTRWQASTYPSPWREAIEVVHDGIDTQALRPEPGVRAAFKDGSALTREDEVITFVARHLEPYRGFHTFMRALPALLKTRPQAHMLIVGEDGVSYGSPPPGYRHWRERMLDEVGPQISPADARRVHFLGRLERAAFTRVLQLSRVHIYLTYPFVLSWSLIEAMSIGCSIVASDTAPVREVLADGHNALLVDFFDAQALVRRVEELLDDWAQAQRLSAQARRSAMEWFDLTRVCLPRQLSLLCA